MMILQMLCGLLVFIFIFIDTVYGNDFEQFVDIPDPADTVSNNGIIIEDESFSNITYVCGKNKTKANSLRYFVPQITTAIKDCECFDSGRLNCFSWSKDANIKPFDESFEIKIAWFYKCNITILKRDKILPDNEDTVTTLDFHSSGVRYIEDGAFDKFISLKYLLLPRNKLTYIDEKVLTSQIGSTLIMLSLSNNNLTPLDPMIFKNLINLEHLEFGSNPNLKEFTDIFPKLIYLKFLYIPHCGLKYLKRDVFKNLPKLEWLTLTGNKFSSIPTAAFKHLSNMKFLQMANNSLTKIETNAFASNKKLKIIILHSNPLLVQVDDCAFCGLPNLTSLSLKYCRQLSFIHENAFGRVSLGFAPNVTWFMINECNITVLPEKLLDWKNMATINIGGNPFVCNCSMAWFFNDLLSDHSIYDKKVTRRYHGHRYILGCFPPFNSSGQKHFLKHKFFESCKDISASTNSIWLIFMALFGCIISVGIYLCRHQQQHVLFVHNFIISRYRNIVPANE